MDAYLTDIYREYGLRADATKDEIRYRAKQLLGDTTTQFAGAELILGRRIKDSETEIVALFAFADPDAAIGKLLVQKALEGFATTTEHSPAIHPADTEPMPAVQILRQCGVERCPNPARPGAMCYQCGIALCIEHEHYVDRNGAACVCPEHWSL